MSVVGCRFCVLVGPKRSGREDSVLEESEDMSDATESLSEEAVLLLGDEQ